MIASILIIIVFLIFAFLMITKRISALLAMPFMAFFIAAIAGIFSGMPFFNSGKDDLFGFLFNTVLAEGPSRLATAMMYTVFGSILSQIVQKTGIAERLVKTAAELAGDKKLIVAAFLTVASTAVFGSVTGLGGFIMVSSLVLPVMMAAGLSPLLSSCLILFSLSIGGIFNPANWGFFKDALGVELSVIKQLSISYAVLLSIVCVIFLLVEYVREKRRISWSINISAEKTVKISPLALITPVIPIVLIINPFYSFPVVPSFIIASIYGIVFTDIKKFIPTLTASIIDGIKDIAPVIGLFIGIGMLLNAVMAPCTSDIMRPLLTAIIPSGKMGYILFFFLLAPLALYRGPFNLYGLGSGLAALLIGSGLLSPAAVMAAFLSVGQIQGICDPTNTHNVWLAQYMKVSTNDMLTKTLLYVWVFVLAALVYAVFIRGVV